MCGASTDVLPLYIYSRTASRFHRELPEAEAVPSTFRPAQLPKLKKVLKGEGGAKTDHFADFLKSRHRKSSFALNGVVDACIM
jgi:hypothetical protein